MIASDCAVPAVWVEEPAIEKCVAAPGSTVKLALAPELRTSPLVREAVSTTPDSAFVYVTPEIVTPVPPAEIEPVIVPPSVPEPLVRASETPVAALVWAPAFP